MVTARPARAPQFSIRTAQLADHAAVRAVIAELIPSTDPLQRMAWMYEANPAGEAITWLAYDDASGEVAGATSYFPFALTIGGERVRGALGGDGFVRPAFRRRGIAGALHAAARADMPALGIEVMYGAPTCANVSPLRAGGSRAVGEVVRYFRPLRGSAFGVTGVGDKIVARVLAPRHGREQMLPAVADDPRIDDVWQRTAGQLGIAAVRDARFYTWRFVCSPSGQQRAYVITDGEQPIAVCALEQLANRLRIVDLVAPAEDWPRALAAIERHADVTGCDAVEIKLMRDDARRRAMWKYGFVPREKKPFLCVIPSGSTRARVLHDPAQWFYTGADSDIDTLAE
jgi:GNAT superfamily N-acetyltransferase